MANNFEDQSNGLSDRGNRENFADKPRTQRGEHWAEEQLKKAHIEWKQSAQSENIPFSTTWLQKNGYASLYRWAMEHGGISAVISKCGDEIESDFVKLRAEGRTDESTVEELRSEHAKWKLTGGGKKFNYQWLKESNNALTIYMQRRKGISYYAELAGPAISADFETRVYTTGRTIESAVAELEEAHQKWLSIPDSDKSEFNRTWLDENGYQGLQNWIRKKFVNTDEIIAQTSIEFQRDFKSRGRLEKRLNRTHEDVVEEFRRAHVKWKQSGDLSNFNIAWLQKNGYSGLVDWARRRDFSLVDFAELAGGEIAVDFVSGSVGVQRTEETAIAELQTAFAAWGQSPDPKRGAFNVTWLNKNGYINLVLWMRKNGGVEGFIKKIGGSVKEQFNTRKVFRSNSVEALKILTEAYYKWLSLQLTEKTSFDQTWLKKHGYEDIYRWIINHEGIDYYIGRVGGDAKLNFVIPNLKKQRLRSETDAIHEFRNLYHEWIGVPESVRGSFVSFLRKHGRNLLSWLTRREFSLQNLSKKAGVYPDLSNTVNRPVRTEESVIKELGDAYGKWRSIEVKDKTFFNRSWLRENYPDLDYWIQQNGGLDKFIKKIDDAAEAEKDYKKRLKRTEESVLVELQSAYSRWQSESAPSGTPFNIVWLQKNGFMTLYRWMFDNGGVDYFVHKIGGSLESDFTRSIILNRDEKEVIGLLHDLFSDWKLLKDSDSSKFNLSWIRNKDQRLAAWIQRNGGLQYFIDLSDDEELQKYFEINVSRSFDSVAQEFVAAYELWKSRDKLIGKPFGVGWLQKNGYASMYQWIRQHGGFDPLIKKISGGIENDFIVQKRKPVLEKKNRTEESAMRELEEAHAKWRSLPDSERTVFNIEWLRNNFQGLRIWMGKHGGIPYFVERVGGNVAQDFERTHVHGRTKESAIKELNSAYQRWKNESVDLRGPFDSRWIYENCGGLIYWLRSHGGVDYFVGLCSSDVQNAFSKQVERTAESALVELRRSHQAWSLMPEDERGEFNSNWLNINSNGLANWCNKNGGILKFIQNAGEDIYADFVFTHAPEKTPEDVRALLVQLHNQWKSIPEYERPVFNYDWLKKNSKRLVSWMSKHGGVDYYIAQIGGEISVDYVAVEINDRTIEAALGELREVHAKWKEFRNEHGKSFNISWLQKNAGKIYYWMNVNGGVLYFITLAGGEIARDFERIYRRGRTVETAVLELREVHNAWKNIPESQRGLFNTRWIQKNFSGFHLWLMTHGGVSHYIDLAGGDVQKDFHKSDRYDSSKERELERMLKDDSESTLVDFKKLIRIFGSSGAVVLLYELRPNFKSIPVERVKRVLAEYLGSYLSIKYTFNLKDVVAAAKFLSNPSLRQAIFENVKADCLKFYFEQQKNGSRADAYEVIYNYLVQSLDELGDDIPKVVEDMILEVMDYYTSAIRDFHKPEKFVDKLTEGRDFPDLHQRINMKELRDKKRMLIADEMGLGKSASVIMAKEQMGLGCALVVVPGSVIKLGTWQSYLSDDPARKGYFQPGTAPRVLVVESSKQLEGSKKDQYDYIIVSHERLNGRYATLLAELDPDMLIVDEVHKLKNLKGVRSRSLMPLVNKLGPDKHLALLSGTPIPNKVRDIAFVLKLLYPNEFGKMQDGDLVKTIIQSSADEILKMLIPRMQMKELEDVVEMPHRDQRVMEIKMSKAEADVYEGLLELDELTAREKMGALRKFLMNPALLDSTPAYEGSKSVALRSELQKIFETKSKVIVFVNEYTSGILRGKNAVLVHERLGLPDDVAVEYFFGGDENVRQRASIQNRFNNTLERMVVLISGKTSDVGNSFVAAEETLVYSEPWTEADLRQQLARVFRPGLDHDIFEKIFVVGGTIEQGIHEYIRHKYKIIEKVLKGIPTTELEQRLLKKSENQHDDAGIGDRIDIEINPELARDYFSWKQKLDQFFGHTKENGEERISEFLKKWGADYARGYQEMGARSYQSNVNRVNGCLIGEMAAVSGKHPAVIQILDIASGPEMLRRHIGTKLQSNVSSIDINPYHFANSISGRARVASWTNIPCKPRTIDYVNCAMAFQDSSYAPSKGMYERVNVLREMNRVLKTGGCAVISMIYSMRIADMEKFAAYVTAIGFKVVQEYSGLATRGEDFESQIITLEKIADCEKTAEQVVESVGSDNIVGLKFIQVSDKKLKKSRKVITGYFLDGKSKIIELNDADRTIVHEEDEAEKHVQVLCKQYGSVKNIPSEEVIKNGYIRVFVYGKYHLFKRLNSAPGVLVLNESTS